MDAYDIFKKLSQGAKFKRKTVFKQNTANKKCKLENGFEETIKIKEEPIDEDYLKYEIPDTSITDFDTSEIKIENEDNSEEIERELTLLGSITASESGKKKKKIKKKEFDEEKRAMLERETINQFRNQNQINVLGKNVPAPIKEFHELQVGKDLIKNLDKCGYETPTPIQKQAIPVMLERRQIFACAPTGSGKTAAFLLPIIHHLQEPRNKGFRALIVCPTRELAKQTQRECVRLSEGRGFRIHTINKANFGFTMFGPNSNKKFDILATTPNRLCFLLKQEPPAISLTNVEWLVIDEADKLFEEGKRGFRDQLQQIMAACTSQQLKIAMFSATQTFEVIRWCRRNLKLLISVTIGQRNAATELVDQELLFVGSESGKLLAFRNIVQKGLHPPVLVFVQSKERAQQLFSELIYDGINVDVIHADRTQTQRDNTVRSFREGKIWVLICTELMARGVDFKGVNLVINYDFPPSAIAYIHRVGRAGRAGRKGKAVTFFTTDDTSNLRSIAHVLKQSGCNVPEYMITMKKKKKPKRERNMIIQRDEITTKPIYVREKFKNLQSSTDKTEPVHENKNNKSIKNSSKKINKTRAKNMNVNKKKKLGNKKTKQERLQQKKLQKKREKL